MIIFGLVLAGGRSSRFGREKAGAELDGQMLIARVIHTLARGCDRVAVSARSGSQAADVAATLGLPRLSDDPSYPEGPLAGIKAGLAWAAAGGADALVTAPCDTPFLPDDLVTRLAEGGGAAIARTAEGLQPLCAMWPVSPPEAPSLGFAQGQHPPIRQILAQLNAVEITFPDATAFVNLNTPEDYAAALALISGRARPESR